MGIFTPPLDFGVEIAPDAQPDGDTADWTWLDVTGKWRGDIELGVGRADESSEVEAADASINFDLRDGLLSPRNPHSELYGRIGTNTPVRFRLPIAADTFNRTVAGGWGTADTAQAWSGSNAVWSVAPSTGAATAFATAGLTSINRLVSGGALDLDIRATAAISAITTGDTWRWAFAVRYEDVDNFSRIQIEFRPLGVVSIKIIAIVAGATIDLGEVVSTGVTYTANQKIWVHAQSEGADMRINAWNGTSADEPDGWMLAVSDSRNGGAGFGRWDQRGSGNTNVGTLTAYTDDLTVDALLWGGNIPEWPPTWDKSGNDSTVPVAAAGPLRLLNTGDDAVKSSLTSQLARYGPAGMWPFEDAAGSVTAASALPAGNAATVQDVTFSADTNALPGSQAMAKLDTVSSLVYGLCSVDTGVELAAMLFYQLAALPGVDTILVEWRSAGTIARWQVIANGIGFRVVAYDSATGAKVVDSATTVYTIINPLLPFSVQLETTQNAGNIDWSLIWNQVGRDDFVAATGSVAGTCGRPLSFRIRGATELIDALFGQVWMGPETLPYVDPTFLLVADGYSGELCADRVERMCAERGIGVAISSGASEPAGRQGVDKFLAVLRETAETDPGVLYERAFGLGYIPRGARYHPVVAMVLDWTGGDLAEAPKPTDDDQRLRNQWTISRKAGSSATYKNDASAARHGTIGDSKEINNETDERLIQRAAWETAVTTVDEMRWPVIEIDLVAHPELIPQFLQCRVGSRLQIVNPKDQVAGITIDLIIEHIQQTLGQHKWRVALTCSSSNPWRSVGIYDDPAHGAKYDAATTTLAADQLAADVSWEISTVKVTEIWSTTGVPYDWQYAGEVVTVTAITAGSGTGPYTQTATVTRAVNGVSKDQVAGGSIRLANPVKWGL